jgi:hypothetical protein
MRRWMVKRRTTGGGVMKESERKMACFITWAVAMSAYAYLLGSLWVACNLSWWTFVAAYGTYIGCAFTSRLTGKK